MKTLKARHCILFDGFIDRFLERCNKLGDPLKNFA